MNAAYKLNKCMVSGIIYRKHKLGKTNRRLLKIEQQQKETQTAIDQLTQRKLNIENEIKELDIVQLNPLAHQELQHDLKLPDTLRDKFMIKAIKRKMKLQFNKVSCLVLGIALLIAILWQSAR